MKRQIIITTQFEALHNWPGARGHVQYDYLADPHRHIFKVKLAKTVHGDDRDIEFIELKRDVNFFIANEYGSSANKVTNIGHQSCEMIAERLLNAFAADWVEVFEDGENGARVETTL